MNLPTEADVAAAHKLLGEESHYTAALSLWIGGTKRLREAVVSMAGVMAHGTAAALGQRADEDYTAVCSNLATSIFANGIAYGLAISQARTETRTEMFGHPPQGGE